MGFTHLHVHTQYSLLDGSCKIKELISCAKSMGMDSLAITDHGVMYGTVAFYKAALEAGIKPIIGCEVYVAPASRFEREKQQGEDKYYHLVLLAKSNRGYKNLMKIVSRGFTEGFYYKPRVDLEVLKEYHEDIIALSACLAGEVQRELLKDRYDLALEAAKRYRDIFGAENFYLELQDHGLTDQKRVIPHLLRMSREEGFPLVCTNDVHYINEEDSVAHDILLCIQTGKRVSDEDRMRYEGGQYFLKSEEQMAALFKYAPEALTNTAKIAEMCNVTLDFHDTKLPRYDVPEGYTADTYLEKLCREGLIKRYGEVHSEELDKRLDYELSTIKQMGYVEYFLIVWDFINYAKSQGIAVGPGRGSAAGSIVSYSLAITDIDPIRFSLLFERFLNPERVSMPDIDVDFCYERRQEVIDYVTRKYGRDSVVQIVTFGTLQARGVIRDVGRVMDLPYQLCDKIAKMIPQELGITIDKALEKSSDLRSACESDPEIANLIDMSKRLEGLPRHASMHAAGVVICADAADEYVPLSLGSDGCVTTQYVMTELEELGLLKMDFLGLRTMTVLRDAVRFVKETTGKEIDLLKIDYDDKAVYDYISTGKTEGIFQIESPGMKSFMRELRPGNIEDIIAGIALYRPGPMDFIPKYLKGKNSGEEIIYDTPELEEILAPTYGCIVYQEQVMQIVMKLAGYTLGRSDLVRRAMSKKKASVMAEERKNFVYGNEEMGVPGCIKNGISEAVANKIYDDMVDFAKYAFNKSHAAAYAVVSYQTAYLKYYYKAEYMAALITSVMDNIAKVSQYIAASKAMGIDILPPDINQAVAGFSVIVCEDGTKKIRYGLCAVKGIGRSVVDSIIEEREHRGPYKSLTDFAERLNGREVSKKTVESFIKAGAFDSFGLTRKQQLYTHLEVMDRVSNDKKSLINGQMSFMDFLEEGDKKLMEVRVPDCGEFSKEILLSFEKDVMGIYVSGHPLEDYADYIEENAVTMTSSFVLNEDGATEVLDGSNIIVGGMIDSITIKYTKHGQPMAFITLEDYVGNVEVIAFPKVYEKYRELITDDEKIFVYGKVNAAEDANAKLIAERLISFNEVKNEVWLRFKNLDAYNAIESDIIDKISERKGEDVLIAYLETERQTKRYPMDQRVNADTFAAWAGGVLGEENVVIRKQKLKNLL